MWLYRLWEVKARRMRRSRGRVEHPTDPLQMAVVLLLLLCSAGVSPDVKKKKKNGGRRVRLARGQVGGAIRSQRGADKSCQSLHHSVTDRTISTQVLAIKGISTRMLCVSISICLSWCFSKTPNKKDFSTDKECKFLHDFFFSLGRSLQILSFSPKVSFNVLAIALSRDTVLNLRKLKGIF